MNIDALSEKCAEQEFVKFSTLSEDAKAKLRLGSLLALAGGGLGGLAGYEYDKLKADPDETPVQRKKRMWSRILTGAGAGALTGAGIGVLGGRGGARPVEKAEQIANIENELSRQFFNNTGVRGNVASDIARTVVGEKPTASTVDAFTDIIPGSSSEGGMLPYVTAVGFPLAYEGTRAALGSDLLSRMGGRNLLRAVGGAGLRPNLFDITNYRAWGTAPTSAGGLGLVGTDPRVIRANLLAEMQRGTFSTKFPRLGNMLAQTRFNLGSLTKGERSFLVGEIDAARASSLRDTVLREMRSDRSFKNLPSTDPRWAAEFSRRMTAGTIPVTPSEAIVSSSGGKGGTTYTPRTLGGRPAVARLASKGILGYILGALADQGYRNRQMAQAAKEYAQRMGYVQ